MVFDGADGSQSDQLERFSWQGLQNNYEIHYQYDANGNITQTTDGKGKIQYTYDTRNQLIREDREADRQTITYAYDKNGNLLQKNRYEYQPEATMETLASATPSETKIYRYEGNWKDQLTSYNGETIAYDTMGNPTVYRGMEMGWKNSSELTEIEKDQTTIRYRYDKEGMRNRKYLSDGTTVLYQVQDGQIIGEQHLREDQEKPLYEMTFSYDADGTLFSMNCDGKDYYYILNPTGDVIALVDTGWNTVVSYAYDSWGKVTAIEGDQDLGKKNPLRYRGYYWDEETGLYYLASRYYDPEVGRFINADDTGTLEIQKNLYDKNLYAYCDNNPVMRKDETGDIWITAVAIGAGMGLLGQYISDIQNNISSGARGINIFAITSSRRDYLASAVGGGIAAIPGLSLAGTIAVGALGNVVTDSIKKNIKSGKDLVTSAVWGAGASASGIAVSKGVAALKVKKINKMPRAKQKRYINRKLYRDSQANININYHKYMSKPIKQKIAVIENNLRTFKAGIYSTVTSTIAGFFRR